MDHMKKEIHSGEAKGICQMMEMMDPTCLHYTKHRRSC